MSASLSEFFLQLLNLSHVFFQSTYSDILYVERCVKVYAFSIASMVTGSGLNLGDHEILFR